MWFWWFMFFCNLLIPILLIIAGRMMWKHCPKQINGILGYRTRRSMQNTDTWKFAHDYCGRLWWKIGWIMLILSVFVQIPFVHSSDDLIGIAGSIICTIQCIVLVLSIFPTEKVPSRVLTSASPSSSKAWLSTMLSVPMLFTLPVKNSF